MEKRSVLGMLICAQGKHMFLSIYVDDLKMEANREH